MGFDQDIAGRVREILAGRADIVEKPMMGGLAFIRNDGMFCSVSGRGGLLVRVEPSWLDAALREPHVERADVGGRKMTGFVRVLAEGLSEDAALRRWVERAIAAASAAAPKLKAKPKAASGERRQKR